MDKPILSKQAFWDVDMDSIDYEKNALYVIEKVFKKGSFEDFIALKNFYGENRLRNEVINSEKLDSRDVNFFCITLGLKIGDFKHNIKRYSYPVWDFTGA